MSSGNVTGAKVFQVPEADARLSGVGSLRVASGSGRFLGADGSEVGTFQVGWSQGGGAEGTITRIGASPIRFDISFSKDATGQFLAKGTLDGQPFYITTSSDNKLVDRSAPINIDPKTAAMLKSVASIRSTRSTGEPNPPTVPREVIHEAAGKGKAPIGQPVSPEISGDCAIAIIAAVEFAAATGGVGGFFAGVAVGYACRQL
jgi:hypothetical protein